MNSRQLPKMMCSVFKWLQASMHQYPADIQRMMMVVSLSTRQAVQILYSVRLAAGAPLTSTHHTPEQHILQLSCTSVGPARC